MAVGKLAKSVMGLADEFLEGASKGIGDAGRIKATVTKMASNQTKSQLKYAKKGVIKGAVKNVPGIQKPTLMNQVGDAMVGGIRDARAGMQAGQGISQALATGYMKGDKLRMDRVAGTFVGASAAARVATGGGLYKDRNGSTNIIGLPFI
jgi:hypothetical protein